MSMLHLFGIGRSGIYAAQLGLQVTGNNIANVNTSHYSRQRLSQNSGIMVNLGGVPLGTGVAVDGVRRLYDSFLGIQVGKAYSELADCGTREGILSRAESLLHPSADSHLGTILNEFFSACQDLTGNPGGLAERQGLLSAGEELAASFRSLHRSLEGELEYTNTELQAGASEVNKLAAAIAGLNYEIIRYQGAQGVPNDLMDQRDALIQELSGYVDVTAFEQQDGSVAVLVSGSQTLVDGATAHELKLVPDMDDERYYRLTLNGQDLTDRIQAGKLHGVLTSREHLAGYQHELDLLAATLSREVNRIHQAGYDLDGNPGEAFFTPLRVTSRSYSTNQGGAGVTLQEISDPAAVSFDDYEIRFRDGGTYDILNVTTGAVVAENQLYTPGAVIEFDGLRIALDQPNGPPAAGDRFLVSTTQDMARDLSVGIEDPRGIAAAQDPLALPGDNRNALALAELASQKVVRDGSMTLGGFFDSMIADVGGRVQDAARVGEAKQVLYDSLESQRNSVSGVSLEEEEVRLLAYQHAYQAAAKFMDVVGEMLEDLLQL